MNRAHTGLKAIEVINAAHSSGFENISIDLIYGLPKFLNRDWSKDIETALGLNVQHISSYNLTREKSTKLHRDIVNGKYVLPDQESCSEEFDLLTAKLASQGFHQYEVSNFSIEGYRSLHNSSYWTFKPYLGIGPSAHSYDGKKIRRWNVSNNKQYIKGVKHKEKFFQQEELSNEDLANEHILMGTRTENGVDLAQLKLLLNSKQQQILTQQIVALKDKSLVTSQDNRLVVTKDNFLLSDYIARELFILPL